MKKKSRQKKTVEQEQLSTMRMILAELQKLNASLASARVNMQGIMESDSLEEDDGEELEHFE